MTLDDRLDAIFAARDRAEMQPTIDALLPLHQHHPGHARVLYELAGAYDTAGQEAVAAPLYERALEAGLEGDLLRRCYLQLGSTLRNLQEHGRALAIFEQARAAFPASASVAVFQALSLHAAGRGDEAFAGLLDVVADLADAPDIDRYRPAIRANAEYLRGRDAPSCADAAVRPGTAAS